MKITKFFITYVIFNPPMTSSLCLLSPNTLLSSLFSNMLNLQPSFRNNDKVSQQ
jgi:hypothetical protein